MLTDSSSGCSNGSNKGIKNQYEVIKARVYQSIHMIK